MAQAKSDVFQTGDKSCEANAALIEALINDLKNTSNRLFVVAHRGQSEKSRQYNYRRLYNAKAFIIGTFSAQADKVTFAEGEEITGKGQVRFYMGNDLRLRVTFRHGADFCVTCCDFPNPCYYSRENRIKKRSKKCSRLKLTT